MKLICLFVLTIVRFFCFGQNWSFSPIIGNAITVSGADKGIRSSHMLDNYGLGFNYPKLHYRVMSPLTFGLRLNYTKDRIMYSTGLIFGDQSESKVQFYTIGPKLDNEIQANIFSFGGSGSGLYNFKIPLSVNYKLSPSLRRPNGVEVSVYSGINFVFYKKWNESSFDSDIMKKFTTDGNDGWMILPYEFYSTNANYDEIRQVYWSANLNKGINLSFDLGLNLDWYLKSRHWFTTSLYYEQGVRNVSAIVSEIYVNGEYVGLDGAYSRGSAIHLKLLFPITLKKKKE